MARKLTAEQLVEKQLNSPLLYEHAARTDRIDRLSTFLATCARQAQTTGDWYSRHAIWAVQHLEQLDYRFPECDPMWCAAAPTAQTARAGFTSGAPQ